MSADHGGPEIPGYLQELKLPGGYVSPKDWDESAPIDRLKKSLAISEPLIEAYHHPYIYLDQAIIAEHKLDVA